MQLVQLTSKQLSVTILIDCGGKIVSIFDTETNLELLWQPENGKFPHCPSEKDPVFSKEYSYGFDDMFPTILPCQYPDPPWMDQIMPDHGEVWSQPWTVEKTTYRSVRLETSGRDYPYVLQKQIILIDSTIHIEYVLENCSKYPIASLWAAHPLFSLREGMLLKLPQSVTSIINAMDSSSLPGGCGDILTFPAFEGSDLGILDIPVNTCRKFYVNGPVPEGWCELHDPDAKHIYRFEFPNRTIPYIGIWINRGGWGGQYNIGVEPASAIMDSPVMAREFNGESVLRPLEIRHWYLDISVKSV